MFIHTAMLDAYGGGLGVRDQGLIESALHRPLASYAGSSVYRTPFGRAATLWWGLIKNHGFVDGNKRTSTMAALLWLDREGYELKVSDRDIVEVATAIANDQHTVETLGAWLQGRAQPARAHPEPEGGRGAATPRPPSEYEMPRERDRS